MGTPSAIELQSLLEELASKHKVPGATLAVLHGDDVAEAATGVINKDTGVEVTTDTLFQIGSITKVWTATLVLQLVDAGQVELDEPVRTYLPELELADPEAAESITARQLLSHTAGLDDNQKDTGRGDDCVRKFVESCATLTQIAAPGALLSYSNPGLRIAGRLVEVLTGQTWNAALEKQLLDPLGTRRTVTLPEEAILHRTAVGHLDPANSGELTRATVWHWPRSSGPSGGIISTAAELLSFARLHLDGGIAADGTTVLSRESVRAMQEQQVSSPDEWLADGWGLGWALHDWGGKQVIGHSGGGVGQTAFLQILPDAGFAVALLTNANAGLNLSGDVFKQLFAEHVGIDVPGPPEVDEGFEFEPSLYAGAYQAGMVRIEVELEDGGLVASVDRGGYMLKVTPVRSEPLKPIDDGRFLMQSPGMKDGLRFVFFDADESGRPRYLHSGGRAYPRVDT